MAEHHECPSCHGRGHSITLACGPNVSYQSLTDCLLCGGSGSVDAATLARVEVGRRLRAERIARGESQADAAARLGTDKYRYSKVEHGLVDL